MAANQPACTHKAERGCLLSSLERCCSCVDKRPYTASYKVYVDGSGLVSTPHRWLHYCPPCRAFYEQASCSFQAQAQKAPRKTARKRRTAERRVTERRATERRATERRGTERVVADNRAAGRSVCSHKAAVRCQAFGDCCACADQRTQKGGRYDVNVVGVGVVAEGSRWKSYCPPCRERCAKAARELDRVAKASKAVLDANGESTVDSKRTVVGHEKCAGIDDEFDAVVVEKGDVEPDTRHRKPDKDSYEEGMSSTVLIATIEHESPLLTFDSDRHRAQAKGTPRRSLLWWCAK